MFQCPDCKERGIGFWAKFWSGSDSPASCKVCGALSYVHSKHRLGYQSALPLLVSWLLIALTIYASFASERPFILASVPVIWLGGKSAALALQPLTPITKEQSTSSRRFGNLFAMGFIVLIIVWILVSGL